jgi:hypothetical protein
MSQTPSGRALTFISDHILGITASFLMHSAHAQFISKTWTKLSPNGHNIIALLLGRPQSIKVHSLAALKNRHRAPNFNMSLQCVTQNTLHHRTITRRHCRSHRCSPCSTKTSKQIDLGRSSSVKTRHTAPKFNNSLQSVAQDTLHHSTIAWRHCTSHRG